MPNMQDNELLSILDNQISNAIGGYSSDLEGDQADALDYYYGQPYGDEVDGQSRVVTRDVLETVERILASLLKVFVASDNVVTFDPTGAEDIEQANQETALVNHVIMKENNGFILFHDWMKGALLQKNGYIKVWPEEKEDVDVQTYTKLTDQELAELFDQDGEIEPLEHEEYMDTIEIEGFPVEYLAHDIKLRVTTKKIQIKIMVVPQEDMGISRNADKLSVADCSFVFHKARKTVSDLINEGFDADLVRTLPGWDALDDGELEIARETHEDEDTTLHQNADESTREVTVFDCWVRVDYDGDGVSELRHIVKSGNQILENEEADFIPFAVISPIPMPHKHIGLGEADLVMDIQRIRSVLLRQMLNNLYLTNNPEKEVVDGQVNLDDLLSSQPGGVKRVKVANSIREITVPFTAGASLPMLEVLDSMVAGRTGQSAVGQGLDPNVLANSTAGAFMVGMEKANELTEKIARVFAETGYKELCHMVHELLIKHQDKPKIIKIKNKYVPIDPTEWKHRSNMTVTVGLGTGNKDAILGRLFTLAEKQEQHLLNQSPLVTPQNLYNTYERIIETSDLKDVSLYFSNPEDAPPQQPEGPDPQAEFNKELIAVEREKNQISIQKAQMDNQKDMQKMQIDYESKIAALMAKIEQENEKSIQEQAKLEQRQIEHFDKMEQKYTEMEAKYLQDIPGSAI